MSRFRKITGHVYNVENQNGFNNALYDYFNATDDGKDNTRSKKTVREMVQNFPKTYPTNIVIIDQSFECGRVYVETFELDLCLPSKDEVVDIGFRKATNADYNFRKVCRDLDHDLYYSGWMDCYDWISRND